METINKKELREKYIRETNKSVHYEDAEYRLWNYTFDYTFWLEGQLIELIHKYDNKITGKMTVAEDYVKSYIKENNNPPTYRQVAEHFGLAVCAAYARLRHCRGLMKR